MITGLNYLLTLLVELLLLTSALRNLINGVKPVLSVINIFVACSKLLLLPNRMKSISTWLTREDHKASFNKYKKTIK